MAFAAGTRFGPYRVTGLIGVGGMGEVYRASDTKLGREVAIKALPTASQKSRPSRTLRARSQTARLTEPRPHRCDLWVARARGHAVSRDGARRRRDAGTEAQRRADAGRRCLALHADRGSARSCARKSCRRRDLRAGQRDGLAERRGKAACDFGHAEAFSGNPERGESRTLAGVGPAMTQRSLILGTAGCADRATAWGAALPTSAPISRHCGEVVL